MNAWMTGPNGQDRAKVVAEALDSFAAAVRAEAFEEMATQLQPMLNEHRSNGWRNAMTVSWNIAKQQAEKARGR